MEFELCSGALVAHLHLPDDAGIHGPASADHEAELLTALKAPLGLPQVHQCAVSGDSVVIVIDPETPQLIEIVTLLWEQFQAAGDTGLNLTLLFPSDPSGNAWQSLVDELPVHVRNQAAITIHDPTDEQQRRYLASSASGDRIYLAHHLVDADLIVTVGSIGFDSLLGYRGTNSAIYPEFSDSESIQKYRGIGHAELTPDDKRPLRELVDEVGWLLGTQFTIQVIPDSKGTIDRVFCGAVDRVMDEGREYLKQQWELTVDDFADLAVISIPRSVSASGWRQLGAALSVVAHVVEDGGRVAVVADLPEPVTPALGMLRRCNEPDELLKPLSLEPPVDAVEASQIICALQRSTIYLLSSLADNVVEELGLLPLSSEVELQRLVDAADYPVALPAANYSWPSIASPSQT